MRARDLIFHLNCFCCVLCKIPLSAGDTAALQHGELYCGDHLDNVEHLTTSLGNSEPPTHSFYCASPQKGRPRKRKTSPLVQTPETIGLTLTPHPSLLDPGHLAGNNQHDGSGPGTLEPGSTELRLGERDFPTSSMSICFHEIIRDEDFCHLDVCSNRTRL